MKISSQVTVQFESDSGQRSLSGPFGELWLVDACILTDLDQSVPLAQFLYEESSWRLAPEGTKWRRIVFTEST